VAHVEYIWKAQRAPSKETAIPTPTADVTFGSVIFSKEEKYFETGAAGLSTDGTRGLTGIVTTDIVTHPC